MSFRKNILSQYGSQLINVVCTLLSSILIARLLGSDGKGSLDLYILMYSFAVIAFGFGMPQAFTNFIASKNIIKKHIISNIFILSAVGTAAFSLILLSIQYSSLHFNFFSINMSEFYWKILLIIHVFFLLTNSLLNAILYGENKFSIAAGIATFGSIFLLILYGSMLFIAKKDLQIYLAYIAISSIVVMILQTILYIIQIKRIDTQYVFSSSINPKELKNLWHFSSWVFFANLLQFFNYKMDVWFIHHYHQSVGLIGVYTLAVSLAQMIWILPRVFHEVLITETAANHPILNKITALSNKMFLYAIIMGAIGFTCSIYLVPVLFGADFKEAYSLIGILLLGIIPMSGAMCFSAYFSGIKRADINFKGTLLGFIICLLLDFILIPGYAAKGAAWATVASYMAISFYYFFCFYKMKQEVIRMRDSKDASQ